MDQEIIELRSVLRSLVVSSPTQVDVRSLLRDYRNMMGSPIPLAKYGYRDPLLFLKERCGDCFLLTGPSSNPVLTLIVPDTLKHIDQFVQKQKLSSTVKHKGKRRSVPGALIPKQSNLVVNTFKPNVTKNNRVNQEPERSKEKPSSNSSAAEQRSIDPPVTKTVPISKSLADVNRSDKENKQINGAVKPGIREHEYCSRDAVQKFLKKRLPAYSETSLTINDHSCDNEQTSLKDDGDSGRQTSSSNSSSKAARLEELKTEIKDLIADYPEGVLCTDLIRLYRERYGRELEFSRFGYTSILSVVMVVGEGVAVGRDPADGEWVVTPAHASRLTPTPAPAPRPQPHRRRALAPPHAVDPEDALPGIDFDPDVFPEDCMHFMDSIPAAALAALSPGAMLEVVVGEVYSPSHFWLLRLGPDHYQRMEEVMDEMTSVYALPEDVLLSRNHYVTE